MPDEPAPVRRRGAVLAVVVVLAGLVGAVALRGEPARPVLGQVGSVTGVSASGPPPDGLRVAWEHEFVGRTPDEGVVWSAPSRTVVAAGGLVRVGTRVADAGTGELVRLAPRVGEGATAVQARLVDGELVVVDTLTGRVRARAPADGLPDHVGDWPDGRSGDVSLFGGDTTSVLVRDDGTRVTEVDGRMLPYLDRAFEDPAAFPVRRFGDTGRDEDLTAPLRLVDAATGAVLLEDAGPGARVADVVGDLAMVASTEQDVAAPGQEVRWTVRLVAATSGDERDRLRLASAEAPRLLGTFDDGTAVVATRTGREVTLRAVPTSGPVHGLGTVSAGRGRHDGPYVHSSPVLAAVGMTDGSLVVAGDGEVRAIDAAGVPVWRHDTVGEPSLAVGDGLLALLPEDVTRSTRVLDAVDGTQVVALRASPADDAPPGGVPTGGTLVGVLDGHVGVADAPTWSGAAPQLGTSRWLRLTTGAPTPFDDVVGPFAGDERVTGMWTFHGTVLDPATGRAVPVISVDHDREVLHLLEPGEGLVSHELPLPDRDQVAGRFAAPVGATADLFAVWSEAMADEVEVATHVVDRRTGEVRTLPDVVGVALTAERLLALEPDRAWRQSPLVAVDPVTGERQWQSDLEHGLFGSTTRFDDELFVTSDVLGVRAVSMQDGSLAWAHEADTELSGPLVLGARRALVATTDGVLVALDRTAGAELWRAGIGTPIASMTGAGDHVLLGTHDGVVVHLDADGHEVQRIAVGTGSVRAVAALGDTVVAVVDGVVVGLRTDGTGITTRNEVDVP